MSGPGSRIGRSRATSPRPEDGSWARTSSRWEAMTIIAMSSAYGRCSRMSFSRRRRSSASTEFSSTGRSPSMVSARRCCGWRTASTKPPPGDRRRQHNEPVRGVRLFRQRENSRTTKPSTAYQKAFGASAPVPGAVAQANYEALYFLEALARRSGDVAPAQPGYQCIEHGLSRGAGPVGCATGAPRCRSILRKPDGFDFRLLEKF